jgi:hypothetical protein
MGCVNADVCEDTWPGGAPPMEGEDTCMTCGPWFKVAGFGWGHLDIDYTPVTCAVCLDTLPSVKLPQCTHRLCFQCFRDIMFWDEQRSHLSPVPFGCPPCPNACENPDKGRQCDCEEYFGDFSDSEDESVVGEWRRAYPLQYEAYNDAENVSIDTPTDDSFGKAVCPLCHTKYKRN